MKDLPEENKAKALELAKTIAKGRLDPVYFGEQLLGLKFHAKQKIWLWLTTKTRTQDAVDLAKAIKYPLPPLDKLEDFNFLKNILKPGNRFGKTFVTSVKHVWYNFYKIGLAGEPKNIGIARYSTLNLSPNSMQVDALYRYVVDILSEKFVYEYRGQKIRNTCKIKEFMIGHLETKREIVFANNSKVKGAVTGDNQASSIQGADFYYISYDEAPQSIHLRGELPGILSRLIDSGGPLDIIGTPEVDKPSHQYYSRIVKLGMKMQDGYFTLVGNLDENEFLDEQKKAKALESIGQTDKTKLQQIRSGEFVSAGGKLFPTLAIEKLWEGEFLDPMEGHKYLTAVDWGFADDGDPTIIYVLDLIELLLAPEDFIRFYGNERLPHARVVRHVKLEGPNPYEALTAVKMAWELYNSGYFVHDSTSMGGVMLKKMLRSSGIKNILDFSSNSESKDEMLFSFSKALTYRMTDAEIDKKWLTKHDDFGKIRCPLIPELEEQLGVYKVDDKKLEQDEVMALGMAAWFIEKKFKPAGHVPVYNLNILANDPKNILTPITAGVKVRTIEIKERII